MEVYICDQVQAGPKGTSKLHEMAQTPMVSTLATVPSLSQPAPMAYWGVLYNQLAEEEKTQAWSTDGFHDMQAPPVQCWTTVASTIDPFWDIPEGQEQKVILMPLHQ